MDDVLVVGIAGGSGSGKTTLANRIAEALDDEVTLLSHDSYYRARHDLSYEERTALNYDHPDAYDTELLSTHLVALRHGETIAQPVYDFSIYDRVDKTVAVRPSRVIVVEGILIFCDRALRDLMDLRVFVDASPDVRVLRRLERDVRERGRSIQSVIEQYFSTVKPMHDAFVEPSRRYADIIVPTDGEGRAQASADLLISRIRAL